MRCPALNSGSPSLGALKARLRGDDHAVARSVQQNLQLLAGAEARLLGGLDGDFFAGLRIAAFAARAGGDHEHAKAGQTNFVARLQRLRRSDRKRRPPPWLRPFLARPVWSESFWMRSFLFTATAPFRDSPRQDANSRACRRAASSQEPAKSADFRGQKAKGPNLVAVSGALPSFGRTVCLVR